MKINYRHIAIEGNIGAGKSTLAQMFAHDLNVECILEEFEDNSFLPKFYEDAERYAFPLEMSFLASRYNQLKKKLLEPGLFQQHIISDYIFPKCLIFSGLNLKDDEFELYRKLFDIIHHQLPQPDLLIYLHQPVERLKWNIAHRGRIYEQQISETYLQRLQEAYFYYLSSNYQLKIVWVEAQGLDFVKNKEDYQKLFELLHQEFKPGLQQVNI